MLYRPPERKRPACRLDLCFVDGGWQVCPDKANQRSFTGSCHAVKPRRLIEYKGALPEMITAGSRRAGDHFKV